MVAEYDRVVYLDVQKTGSTQIEHLLTALFGEPIDRRKHAALDARRPGKLHLISTRDPWQLYASLYRYGRSGRGMAYRSIEAAGRLDAYESFDAFLDLVLDPEQAALVERSWQRSGTAPHLGLMGYRFLRLAVADPAQTLSTVRSDAHADRALDQHGVVDEIIENARLEHDLAAALTRHAAAIGLDDRSLDELAQWMRTQQRANTSDGDAVQWSATGVARVAARESWLVQRFGYEPPAT